MPGSYPPDPLQVAFKGRRVGTQFRRVIWSTSISLGRRFGQLWPR